MSLGIPSELAGAGNEPQMLAAGELYTTILSYKVFSARNILKILCAAYTIYEQLGTERDRAVICGKEEANCSTPDDLIDKRGEIRSSCSVERHLDL